MIRKIPILNIYYLLSYAWDRLDRGDPVDVGSLDGNNISNLMAHVLIGGTQRLIKKGLDKGYIEQREELVLLRGTVDFERSIQQVSRSRATAVCCFEDLSPSLLQNQILRTTLRKLSNVSGLDSALKKELKLLWNRLIEIPETEISAKLFHKLQFNRNSALYVFLMDICALVHDCLLPDEKGIESRFTNFLEDPNKMEMLFQHFVRNFYEKHLPEFKVTADYLKWDAIPERIEDETLLPVMRTDIVIRSNSKTWIIDTKYHEDSLSENEGTSKLKSDNMYQMFAYVKNMEKKGRGSGDISAEGILLYPTTSRSLDSGYFIHGHRIRACTIDLSQEWKLIHNRLLRILEN